MKQSFVVELEIDIAATVGAYQMQSMVEYAFNCAINRNADIRDNGEECEFPLVDLVVVSSCYRSGDEG